MANTPVRTAGHDPSVLVTAWFAISTAIVFWDAGFCLLRPLSFTHPLWSPYRLYQRIDLVYSPATFERFDGFTAAQALLNLVENSMNMTYLVMARQKNPTAVLVGFTAVLLTFWKTTRESLIWRRRIELIVSLLVDGLHERSQRMGTDRPQHSVRVVDVVRDSKRFLDRG